MPSITESNNLGDLLKYEAPNLYSRETATLSAGHSLTLGTVVAFDVNGDLVPLDPTANDNTAIASGILAAECDALLMARDDALVIVRHAVISPAVLTWPDGITDTQKVIATQQLAERGIVLRTPA